MAAICRQRAHIFLVSVHLFVYCVEIMLHLLGCKPLGIFIFSSLLLLPSTFMPFSCTLAWPYLFCLTCPFFFLLLVLCLHIYIGLCCRFLLLLEFLFILFFHPHLPRFISYLFLSFLPPSILINQTPHTYLTYFSPRASLKSVYPQIFYLSLTSIHSSSSLQVQLSFCVTICHFILPSVTQEKPPSCCMTSCTPSPLKSSWCPAAVVSPRWWLKLLACGTS